MSIEQDPFDHLLSLEDEFYKEGYDLGVSDGERAGLVEGRAFGLEKAFEKYVTMGQLHGRAMILAGRLPGQEARRGPNIEKTKQKGSGTSVIDLTSQEKDETGLSVVIRKAPELPDNTRLETHIRTLYALTEPGSLSTTNSEDSVSEFDDRLKRAEGKIKVIEKLTGECSSYDKEVVTLSDEREKPPKDKISKKDDGSIEDISSLHARR